MKCILLVSLGTCSSQSMSGRGFFLIQSVQDSLVRPGVFLIARKPIRPAQLGEKLVPVQAEFPFRIAVRIGLPIDVFRQVLPDKVVPANGVGLCRIVFRVQAPACPSRCNS